MGLRMPGADLCHPVASHSQVKTHFRLLRHRVLAAAQRWLQSANETGDALLARRTEAALHELHGLLAAL